jgi:hypothetical protein
VYLELAVVDLAQGDRHDSSDDLRLAVTERDDNSGGGDSSTDNLAIGQLRSILWRIIGTTGNDLDLHWRALSGPGPVVQVVKGTRQALVEDGRGTESK